MIAESSDEAPQHTTHGHPGFWAALTMLTFPAILVLGTAYDVSVLWAFADAVGVTLLIFVAEAVLRRRLWIFEVGYVEHISHPDTPWRILVFLGMVLLVLETALILVTVTDRRMDRSLLRLVVSKECISPRDDSALALCEQLTRMR